MAKQQQHSFSKEESYVLDYIKGVHSFYESDFSTQEIRTFALRNGLSPYLFQRIQENKEGIPQALYTVLKSDYLNSLFRHTRIQATWVSIQQLFSDEGLSFIPLKGIFIATHIYADPNTRPMSDLDILLFDGDAQTGFDILIANGGELSAEEPAEHDKSTGHHLQGIIYKGVLIELHTSLFPLDVNHQIPNDVIKQNLIQYKGTTTLSPMLNLCYLCLHAYSTMRRGGIRLSWFLDLKLLAQSPYFTSDKTDIQKLIQELNIEHPVIEVLMKTEFIFGQHFAFLPDQLRKPLSTKDKSDFILFIRNSEQQNTSHSYAIAIERLKNTKGLGNKLTFLKSVLLRGGNKDLASLTQRLYTVGKRFLGMLFDKK